MNRRPPFRPHDSDGVLGHVAEGNVVDPIPEDREDSRLGGANDLLFHTLFTFQRGWLLANPHRYPLFGKG